MASRGRVKGFRLEEIGELFKHESTLNLVILECENSDDDIDDLICKENYAESVAYTSLLKKYPTFFFFAKTWWISMKRTCMRRP